MSVRRMTLAVALGVLAAVLILSGIVMIASAKGAQQPTSVTVTHRQQGPSGGGWEKLVKTTSMYWKNVGNRTLPCRSAKVEIHKWGPSGTFYEWRVWQWLTACIVAPRRGVVWIWWQHHSVNANVCQYGCDIAAMTFAQDSWGCTGRRCTMYGHANQFKITRDLDLLGFHARWYPKIAMTFYVAADWQPGRGRLAFKSTATCSAC